MKNYKDNTERSADSNVCKRVTVRGRDLNKVGNSSKSALALNSSVRYDLSYTVMYRGMDKKLFPHLISGATKLTFLDPANFEFNKIDSSYGDIRKKQRGEFGGTL
jgi:hypothetical protein